MIGRWANSFSIIEERAKLMDMQLEKGGDDYK